LVFLLWDQVESIICALGCLFVMVRVLTNTKIDLPKQAAALCCAILWVVWIRGGAGQISLFGSGVLSILIGLAGKMADASSQW
jgi:hypothetical protein